MGHKRRTEARHTLSHIYFSWLLAAIAEDLAERHPVGSPFTQCHAALCDPTSSSSSSSLCSLVSLSLSLLFSPSRADGLKVKGGGEGEKITGCIMPDHNRERKEEVGGGWGGGERSEKFYFASAVVALVGSSPLSSPLLSSPRVAADSLSLF